MDTTTAKLEVKQESISPCTVKLEIQVPVEEVQVTYQKHEKEVSQQAKIQGFRPGHIPSAILRQNYGSRIEELTLDELVNRYSIMAIKQVELQKRLIAAPMLLKGDDKCKISPDAPFTFAIQLELSPEIKLPDYKGLQLSREIQTVTEKNIEDSLDNLLESASTLESAEGPTQQKDILIVEYEAIIPEGLEVPEQDRYITKAERTWLPLHEPEMLPGASTLLVGLNKGDEKDTDITFPDDFKEEFLRGKTLHYHFKIHDINRIKRPELSDKLAQKYGANDLTDLRQRVRKGLQAKLEDLQRDELIKQIHDHIFNSLDFPLSEMQVKAETNVALCSMIEREQKEGTSYEEIREKIPAMREQAAQEVTEELRIVFVLMAIAEAENIVITDEIHKKISMYVWQQEKRDKNATTKELRKFFQKDDVRHKINMLENNQLANMVYNRIIELADIIDVQPKPEN